MRASLLLPLVLLRTADALAGLSSAVNAIAIGTSTIYVGGAFTSAYGGTANSLEFVASWNGTTWGGVGTGSSPGLSNTVNALAVLDSTLYAGGVFTSTYGGANAISYVASWNGTAWCGAGAGSTPGLSGTVSALAVSGSTLYAGGLFTSATGGISNTLNFVAKWNGTTWSGVGTGSVPGLNHMVYALAVSGSELYAGGLFTSTYGGAVNLLNYIAKWNGTAWSGVGTGSAPGLSNTVYALAVFGPDVYAGGSFTSTYGGTANSLNYIAKWDGTAWSGVGTGSTPGLNARVNAFAVSGMTLYLGGAFTADYAGGAANSLSYVAQWNGTAFSGVSTGSTPGLSGTVSALAVSGTSLYAGGSFSTDSTGATSLNNIAQWNGAAWGPLSLPTPTSTGTATATSTGTATATSTSTPSTTGTGSPSSSGTVTATSSGAATATSTSHATLSRTPFPTNTPSGTPTVTNSITLSSSATPTATSTSTVTASCSGTAPATLTATPSVTGSPSAATTTTAAATPTSSLTPRPSLSATGTSSASRSGTLSSSTTGTPSASAVGTPLSTGTPTNSPSAISTRTPTATATASSSLTATPSAATPYPMVRLTSFSDTNGGAEVDAGWYTALNADLAAFAATPSAGAPRAVYTLVPSTGAVTFVWQGADAGDSVELASAGGSGRFFVRVTPSNGSAPTLRLSSGGGAPALLATGPAPCRPINHRGVLVHAAQDAAGTGTRIEVVDPATGVVTAAGTATGIGDARELTTCAGFLFFTASDGSGGRSLMYASLPTSTLVLGSVHVALAGVAAPCRTVCTGGLLWVPDGAGRLHVLDPRTPAANGGGTGAAFNTTAFGDADAVFAVRDLANVAAAGLCFTFDDTDSVRRVGCVGIDGAGATPASPLVVVGGGLADGGLVVPTSAMSMVGRDAQLFFRCLDAATSTPRLCVHNVTAGADAVTVYDGPAQPTVPYDAFLHFPDTGVLLFAGSTPGAARSEAWKLVIT